MGSSLPRALASAASLVLLVACAAPPGARRDLFDARDYGASGRRGDDARPAIQRAVDACAAAGGGTVLFPPGAYTSGSIELRSHVRVVLVAGATVYSAKGKENFPTEALFHGQDLQNVTLEGRGSIDGQAEYECTRRDWFWWGDGDPIHFNVKRRSDIDPRLPAEKQPPAGSIQNVLIRGVIARGTGQSSLEGHPTSPLENVTIDGLELHLSHDPRAPYETAEQALSIRRARTSSYATSRSSGTSPQRRSGRTRSPSKPCRISGSRTSPLVRPGRARTRPPSCCERSRALSCAGAERSREPGSSCASESAAATSSSSRTTCARRGSPGARTATSSARTPSVPRAIWCGNREWPRGRAPGFTAERAPLTVSSWAAGPGSAAQRGDRVRGAGPGRRNMARSPR